MRNRVYQLTLAIVLMGGGLFSAGWLGQMNIPILSDRRDGNRNIRHVPRRQNIAGPFSADGSTGA